MCWRKEVFKIQGFVCKRFLPYPFFLILALVPISRGQNSIPLSFFAPQPHGNAFYAGYKEIITSQFSRLSHFSTNGISLRSGEAEMKKLKTSSFLAPLQQTPSCQIAVLFATRAHD